MNASMAMFHAFLEYYQSPIFCPASPESKQLLSGARNHLNSLLFFPVERCALSLVLWYNFWFIAAHKASGFLLV